MKLKFKRKTIAGVSTAYIQRTGKGPCLVCIHGNSLSKSDFLPLWEDPRLESTPMVMYDLPGHGDSNRAENPEKTYSISGYASHLKALIDALALKKIVLVGFSLGGHIAIEAAAERIIPELRAIFLTGTPPVGTLEDFPKAFLTNPGQPSLFNENLTLQEALRIAGILTSNIALHQDLAEAIIATDPACRRLLVQSLQSKPFQNERIFIRETTIPVTLLYSKLDKTISLEYIQSLDLQTNPHVREVYSSKGEHIPDWQGPGGAIFELQILLNSINE